MDRWLWNAAPAHAYGLIIFVMVDCALLLAMWKRSVLATTGAALISAVELALMLGDLAVGQPSGVSASSFKGYLLADTVFVSLLATQVVILLVAIAALVSPLVGKHKLTLPLTKN